MEANPALTLHDALNQLFEWDERAEKVSSQRSAAEQEAMARHQEKIARNIATLLRWVMRQAERDNLVDFNKDALRTAATDWANGTLADQDAALQQAFGNAYTPPKKREKYVIEK